MDRASRQIRNLTRALALAALVGLGATVSPAPAPAQVNVYYGEGEFGLYRKQLADFLSRENDIERDLDNLFIYDTYCAGEHPSLQEAADQLAAIEAQYNQLMAQYREFKQGMNALAGHPNLLTGFPLDQRLPGDPNFWTAADQAMAGAKALIAQKRAQLAKARTIDCTPHPPQTTTPPPPQPPPPPPPWPPVAPSEPLAGLTRPPVDNVPLPTLPDHFCTEAERRAYEQSVFDPLYDRAYRAAHDAAGYRADVSHVHLKLVQQIYELEHESKPGTVNPNLLADLKRQEALTQAESNAWEPIALAEMDTFYKFVELYKALLKIPVIDCQPPPPPPHSTGMSAPLPLSLPYPHVPDRFCSEDEKEAELQLLTPLLEKAQYQAAEWAAYAQQTHDANDAQNAQRAADYAAAIEKLVDQVRNAKVKDCDKHSSSFFNNIDIGIGFGFGGGHHDHEDHGHDDHGHDDHPGGDN